MVILALDIATVTGCCDGLVGIKRPRLFSWHLDDAGSDRGSKFALLYGNLTRYFHDWPCDAVVYEAPLGVQALAKQHTPDVTVAFLRGAIGVVEMACAQHRKPIESVRALDARQVVLGWRSKQAKKLTTKQQIMRDVRLLGHEPDTDDEADAYVLWQYACNRSNPRMAIAQTPLFRELPQ